MLVVKVELYSAITGEISELGRMIIANDGTGDHEIGNYDVKMARPRQDLNAAIWRNPDRQGRVEGYDRLNRPVWELVHLSLDALFKKPKAKRKKRVA